MDLPLIPLLQRQLETTLQLMISASPSMTIDEIMLVRIRLTEATLVMGDIAAERSNNATNGKSLPTLRLILTQFLMSPIADTPTTPQNATLQNANTAGGNSSGNRALLAHTPRDRGGVGRPAGRGVIRRPTTRSTTRVNAAIRGSSGSQRARGELVSLIEIPTDTDED